MLSCIATISVNGALRAKLRAIADAGFEHVEIFESDLLASPEPVPVIGAMMRDLGLTCVAFQPFRDFEGMPASHARPRVRSRRAQVRCAAGARHRPHAGELECLAGRARAIAAGSSTTSASSASAPPRADCASASRRWPGRRHIRDHRDAWEIVRQVDHPAVGLALDAFSSLAPGIPIDSLKAIRARQTFPRADRRCAEARHGSAVVEPPFPLHARAGRPAARRVRQRAAGSIGYDGVLSLEIFNDRFRAGSTADVALDGMRSLDYLLRAGGRGERRTRASACKGVEFIEFCASEEEAQQLGQMLRTLGFAPTHRHVRKAVTRWRQGDINLVVNCEPDGFAHSYRHRAWRVGVRDRPARRGSGRGAAPRARSCRSRVFRSRWDPASMRFRRCAASAAACSIS